MPTIIITHASCSDGFCSRWILDKVFPLAKAVSCSYGHSPPNVTDYDVVIADFSFHREVLLEMKKVARSILVLDHHKSAEEELRGLDFCHFDMKRSGAGMTWDHFFPDDPRPKIVSYVEDRDIWNRAMPFSDEVFAVIQSTPFDLEAWTVLADRLEDSFDDVVAEGKVILAAHARLEERIQSSTRRGKILGQEIPVVNSNVLQTELGHLLGKDELFAACWYLTAEGKIRFSLRSEHPDIDVAAVSVQFGGGGHAKAAGFEIDLERLPLLYDLSGTGLVP